MEDSHSVKIEVIQSEEDAKIRVEGTQDERVGAVIQISRLLSIMKSEEQFGIYAETLYHQVCL